MGLKTWLELGSGVLQYGQIGARQRRIDASLSNQ
jgi:hypothetical protein